MRPDSRAAVDVARCREPAARTSGCPRGGLAPESPFSNLALEWQNAFSGTKAKWFESCCEEILNVAVQRLPSSFRPVPIQEVQTNTAYVPILAKAQESSYQRKVRFDLYFVENLHFNDEAVTARMLTNEQFHWKLLNDQMLETLLTTLSKEF
jgi:hypothetical protein